MRDVVAQARLKHAEALGHPDRPAIAVGQVDHAAAALMDGARALCQQDKGEQAEVADHHAAGDPVEDLLLRRRPDLALRKIGRAPVRVVAVGNAAAALIDPQ